MSPQDVVLLLGYTALGHLPTMLACRCSSPVVVTLGRMYRDSEMVIWFASGVGLSRFVRPGAAHQLAGAAGDRRCWRCSSGPGQPATAATRATASSSAPTSRASRPGQFPDLQRRQRVFFIDRDRPTAGTGRNVFILAANGPTASR